MAIMETVELEPWEVPNFARLKQRSDKRAGVATPIPTEELSVEAMDALAREWLGNLYAAAGRSNPWSKNDEMVGRSRITNHVL